MSAIHVAAPLITLGWLLTACGSSSETVSGDAPPAPSEASVAAAEEAPIDACALLTTEDISGLLGTTVEGVPADTPGGPYSCLWENPENYESVSVQIGNADTAINGTLPPQEPGFPEVGTPGPDGMRFLVPGQVEFAAGKRSNVVQVAVLAMSPEEANNAAVALARKIGPQIPE